jgi:hypothetical protein
LRARERRGFGAAAQIGLVALRTGRPERHLADIGLVGGKDTVPRGLRLRRGYGDSEGCRRRTRHQE